MSNSMMHAKLNLASVRHYQSDNSVCAQIAITDIRGNKFFYACRWSSAAFDDTAIYRFSGSKWVPDNTAPNVVGVLKTTFKGFLSTVTAQTWSKKSIKDSKGRVCLVLRDDVFLHTDHVSSAPIIKIDDYEFTAHDRFNLYPRDSKRVQYRMIGEFNSLVGVNDMLDMSEYPDLMQRLERQHHYARQRMQKQFASKPIGYGSWSALQDSRHQLGQTSRSSKQLDKDKGRA